jgi:hypothetical protein
MTVEPKDVDPEALTLLVENGWQWQEIALGFIRRARAGERPFLISREELDRHGLVRKPQVFVTEAERQKGLRWLREEIAKPNPPV